MYFVDSSPGPLYHIDAKITRFGKDGTAAYSMLGRVKAQSKLHIFIVHLQGAAATETLPNAIVVNCSTVVSV